METRTEPGGGLRFAVLGPVRAWRGDEPLGTGAPQQRALLAALLLRGGRTATASELLDAVWGETPPNTALAALRSYAFRLRKALGPDALVTDVRRLRAATSAPDALDSTVVERLAAEAERARRRRPGDAPATAGDRPGPVARRAAGRAARARTPRPSARGWPSGTSAWSRPASTLDLELGAPHRGRLRTDRAVRRAPAARAAARPADARPVPQRPAGRGARRLRRHPPAARRRAGHRPLAPNSPTCTSASWRPTRAWPPPRTPRAGPRRDRHGPPNCPPPSPTSPAGPPSSASWASNWPPPRRAAA